MKIDEKVPETTPINRAATNQRMDSPPNKSKAVSVSVTVRDVFRDRARVSVREKSTTCSKVLWGSLTRFSRIRSKTTMVSWTEKPMTVRTAVTKSESIST